MVGGKQLFDKANKLRDLKDYHGAIFIYRDLLEKKLYDRNELLIQLGGCYYFNHYFEQSYESYKEALTIDPDQEISSLGFYLACTKLDKLEEGLMEMKRYLDKHPPVLFIDTIEELRKGLKNGYATDFRDLILDLGGRREI